jgi:hypothetical protein
VAGGAQQAEGRVVPNQRAGRLAVGPLQRGAEGWPSLPAWQPRLAERVHCKYAFAKLPYNA